MNNSTDSYNTTIHAIVPIITGVVIVCSCIGLYCYKEKNRQSEEFVEDKQNFYVNSTIYENQSTDISESLSTESISID